MSIQTDILLQRARAIMPDLEIEHFERDLELEWVLLGLETGETFWFTAHLGGARDIQS